LARPFNRGLDLRRSNIQRRIRANESIETGAGCIGKEV